MNKNNQCHCISAPIAKQQGMSLVELLISVVVGLFLLTGVISNFISNKNADVKRDAISEMDANAAEALRVLRQTVSHAGYRSRENTILKDDMPFYINLQRVENKQCRGGINRDITEIGPSRRTRDGGERDYLTVISLADNPCINGVNQCGNDAANQSPLALVYTDCGGGGATRNQLAVACSTDPVVGMPDPTDAKIYSSFWLKRYNGSPEDRTLYCDGNRRGSIPIVNDVEAIQFLYGVKNETGQVTFRRANQVTAANQWPMVSSVQVGLLMRSSNKFVLDKPSSKTSYNLLRQRINIHSRDQRRLFKIYTTTINLENRQIR